MPKAILRFNLPEEQNEFNLACDASSMWCVLRELQDFLRGKLKYAELPEAEARVYEEIRSELFSLIQAYQVKEHP